MHRQLGERADFLRSLTPNLGVDPSTRVVIHTGEELMIAKSIARVLTLELAEES